MEDAQCPASGQDDIQLMKLEQVEELFDYSNTAIVSEEEGFEPEPGIKWLTVVLRPKKHDGCRYNVHPVMFRKVVEVTAGRKWQVREVLNAGTPRKHSGAHGPGAAVIIFKVASLFLPGARGPESEVVFRFADGRICRLHRPR